MFRGSFQGYDGVTGREPETVGGRYCPPPGPDPRERNHRRSLVGPDRNRSGDGREVNCDSDTYPKDQVHELSFKFVSDTMTSLERSVVTTRTLDVGPWVFW